jgi:nucleoside-diphosphate-sugar epimerase
VRGRRREGGPRVLRRLDLRVGDPASGSRVGGHRPESPYAASKAAAELWLQTFERLHGLRWTALALNIGTGVETSVRQLHSELAALCGAVDEPRTEPARLGELERSALDGSRARQLLGWEPRTGLRAGLAETVEWLRG